MINADSRQQTTLPLLHDTSFPQMQQMRCHHWCFFHGSNPIQVRTSLANYASHFPIAVTEHWTETIKGDDTFILVHSNDAGLLWTEAKMKKSS